MTGCIRNDKALKIFAEYEENEIVRAEKYPEAPFELSYETKEKIRSTGEMLSEKKKPSLFARKGLMAAAVIILALIVSLAVSPEVRAFVGNIIVTIKENCIEFRSEKNVEWDGAEFELGYLPEGYELADETRTPTSLSKKYICEDKTIYLKVSSIVNSFFYTNVNNYNVMNINGTDVFINGDEKVSCAVWIKNNCLFVLSKYDETISVTEFVKIIEECKQQ